MGRKRKAMQGPPPAENGYEFEVVELGPPVYFNAPPAAKARGPLVPMGNGEEAPYRSAPTTDRSADRPLVPSAAEIEPLPRNARLAFAARCARRVLPAFLRLTGDELKEHGLELEKTVEFAEKLAIQPCDILDDTNARIAYRAADAVNYISQSFESEANFRTAWLAARTAAATADPDTGVRRTVGLAADAIVESATIDSPLTAQLRCIRRDFARLKRLAREQKWTDETPVPPDVFGPMWPPGIEPYWAVEPQPPTAQA